MPSFNKITVPQLSRLIGTSRCPVIIDVSIDDDFNADPYLIPGAFRYPHHSIEQLTSYLTDKKVIVICQKGLKLSAGAAALLRAKGIDAEYLKGGNYEWRNAQQMRVPYTSIPWVIKETSNYRTLWVCAHRPKIDRIACPWLIRRFVDTSAQFLFVAPNEVEAVAEKFGATAFDNKSTNGKPSFWSHRGDKCSLDTMIEEFKLNSPALEHLATIVRAADNNSVEDVPQAAGLLAISLGLSQMYKDDLEQMNAGFLLYDALYRWCRDATNEKHYHQEASHG